MDAEKVLAMAEQNDHHVVNLIVVKVEVSLRSKINLAQ